MSASGAAGLACPVPRAESEFFSAYEWCLDPRLTVEDLFVRLEEELARVRLLTEPWQREESLGNIYLFVCAIACTVDDDLARRPTYLAAVRERARRFAPAVHLVQFLVNAPGAVIGRVGAKRLERFSSRWARCVDAACREIAARCVEDAPALTTVEPLLRLRSEIRAYARAELPERTRRRRMRIPEGLRCQDLTPADAVALARRFLGASHGRREPTAVVGIRTAGAYFAPLVAAVLREAAEGPVEWLTIRPKQHLAGSERWRLRRIGRSAARVLLVDDHPNTGGTLRRAVAALSSCGIAHERVTVLVPRHHVDPAWTLEAHGGGARGVETITLQPEEIALAREFEPRAIEARLGGSIAGRRVARVADGPSVAGLNDELRRHLRDGFHKRWKRAYDVRVAAADDGPGDGALRNGSIRVVAKSVGYGWLGYHAFLAASRLEGFVPRLIGLRHGVMLSEWAGGSDPRSGARAQAVPASALARYVAARARRLPLRDDPGLDGVGCRWSGWDEIVGIPRGVYGPVVGRLKARAIRRALRTCVTGRPALIDGRMHPAEWIVSEHGPLKVDFEHHNFGGAELDVVDPALDLACAIREFGLDERARDDLVSAYRHESGDGMIAGRILIYELLHGVISMSRARQELAPDFPAARRQDALRRLIATRNALTFRLCRFCARMLARVHPPAWRGPLIFLDLDGVLDRAALGFPHTTARGLESLDRLRENGHAVVLNTGRGVEHVRTYCREYRLPGGIAEYGSVFVDAVRGTEARLGAPSAGIELARVRGALSELPDTFLDPGYRYSIRAVRYAAGRAAPVDTEQVEGVLRAARCDALEIYQTSEGTHVRPRRAGKAPAVIAVREALGRSHEPFAAIGNSDADLGMLAIADAAYAPGNCSPRIRRLAATGLVTVMHGPFQRGLWAAVVDLSRRRNLPSDPIPLRPHREGAAGDILLRLLSAADRSLPRQLLSLLDPRRL